LYQSRFGMQIFFNNISKDSHFGDINFPLSAMTILC
jgi:hypothetical protein